jgi:polyisoprenoid-binding protein YceI
MKSYLLLLFASLLSASSYAQTYQPVDAGSKIHFVIKNFAINTGGDFTGLKGAIQFDPAQLAQASFDVSVDASSVDTDSKMRDEHLRESDYFDAEKYPTLRFRSTKVVLSSRAGRYYMFGELTIKGVTKPVEFGFSATQQGEEMVFDGSFKINRRDYNVGEKSISLSDDVKVQLLVKARKAQ